MKVGLSDPGVPKLESRWQIQNMKARELFDDEFHGYMEKRNQYSLSEN